MTRRSSSSSGSRDGPSTFRQPPIRDPRGPSLDPDEVFTALANMIHPRPCQTLRTLGHELTHIEPYQRIFRLKAVYTILVEKIEQQCTADMIAKMSPGPFQQGLYSRELMFYRYLEPQLRQLLRQSPVPRCFLACGEVDKPMYANPSMSLLRGPPDPGFLHVGDDPVLLIQDLTQEGLRPGPLGEMDFAHCSSAVAALASLHAASAVLDLCDPSLTKGTFRYLRSAFPFLVPEDGTFDSMEQLLERGMTIIVELSSNIDLLTSQDVCKNLKIINENLKKELIKILKPHRFQLNTLCHSNCINSSNFLFTQDNNMTCKLIGLSQVRYCRPAVDLSLLFYCASAEDVRTNHEHQLLEIYLDKFNKVLDNCKKMYLKCPILPDHLSKEKLQKSMADTKLLGVALRAAVVATSFRKDRRMREENAAQKEFYHNATYRVKVMAAVTDLLEVFKPLLNKHSPVPELNSLSVQADWDMEEDMEMD